MTHQRTEIEAKFALDDPQAMRARLRDLGAEAVSARRLERNWRFDTPAGDLTRRGQVLRLRQAERPTLAYKRRLGSDLRRQEIEVQVDDLEAARRLLQALGFQMTTTYEKYREVYRLGQAEVMLDELPFGTFLEIEGPSPEVVRQTAARLGLAWEDRLERSYLEIFAELQRRLGLEGRQATFADLADLDLPAAAKERGS